MIRLLNIISCFSEANIRYTHPSRLKGIHIEKKNVLFVLLYILKQSEFDFLISNMFKLNFLYDTFLFLAKCAYQLCKYRRFCDERHTFCHIIFTQTFFYSNI